MAARQCTDVWSAKDELPIEIDLGKDCRYHGIFACPILRQQTTRNNPPVRLICGHVISKDALNKLSNGNNRLKCPYCPVEQNPADARQIYFRTSYNKTTATTTATILSVPFSFITTIYQIVVRRCYNIFISL